MGSVPASHHKLKLDQYMAEKINETDILERLNEAPSVRGFFITTVEVLAQAIDTLMQRIFRKDNFAVQSVVGPLLDDTGPLGNLSVRLKLLYGLGVIADDVYHDIETIIKLRNQLNSDGTEYVFTDPKIIAAIEVLNLVQKMGLLPVNNIEPDGDIDLEFYHLQLQRQQQIIRSGLSLTIIEICNELNKESPF
ncbi:mannitol repressor protein [Vibrio cincinnatiensis]|jgi:mannitol operon repressor|uniref:Mannitol operon repressor n=2 Tax=Vibrio cincinnatiensis TaxID=675 RepID=A0A1T4Q0H8_VIBCI|nr:mannitol operon repressor [Vibrio cincinnatiensis DSM 19608]SUP05249.1 mannitol repressor protein [Vibrio cincinnatiensis]